VTSYYAAAFIISVELRFGKIKQNQIIFKPQTTDLAVSDHCTCTLIVLVTLFVTIHISYEYIGEVT